MVTTIKVGLELLILTKRPLNDISGVYSNRFTEKQLLCQERLLVASLEKSLRIICVYVINNIAGNAQLNEPGFDISFDKEIAVRVVAMAFFLHLTGHNA